MSDAPAKLAPQSGRASREAVIEEDQVDELYALPPEDFVPRRDALARSLRASDRAAAADVKALRRPTVAAWLVNQLVRQEPASLDELLVTGSTLRSTQAAVVAGHADGAALQRLSALRRAQLDRLLTAAAGLAAAADRRGAPLDAVEATLIAATADEDAAAAVRSGRLVKELSYSGFGLSDDPADVVATPLRLLPRPQTPASQPGSRSGSTRVAEPATKSSPSGGRAGSGPGRDAGPGGRGGRGGRAGAAGTKQGDPTAPHRSAAQAAAAQALREAQATAAEACGRADDAQRAYEGVAAELARHDEGVTRLADELERARSAADAVRDRHDRARSAAKSAHAEAERRRAALGKAQVKLDRLRGE